MGRIPANSHVISNMMAYDEKVGGVLALTNPTHV